MSRERRPYVIYNSPCLRCNNINFEMIRYGCLVFCEECFEKVFCNATSDEEKQKLYSHWLARKKQLDEEWLNNELEHNPSASRVEAKEVRG